MKTMLMLVLFMFSQISFAAVCRDMLYINVNPQNPKDCVKQGKNYCCKDGGRQGVYENGAYYYNVQSNYPPAYERVCQTRVYCNPMDTLRTSCQHVEVCNDDG